MSEEEVGGRGGRRAPPQRAGMGLGLKILLATAVPALLAFAVVAFAGGGDTTSVETQMNDVGFRTAGALAAMGPSAWGAGGGRQVDGWKQFERNMKRLFGTNGERFLNERLEWLNRDPGEMTPEERQIYLEQKQEFEKTKKKLGESDSDADAAGLAVQRLGQVAQGKPTGSPFEIMGAWVARGTISQPEEKIAESGYANQVVFTDPTWTMDGGRQGWRRATFTASGVEYPGRVYAAVGGSITGASTITAYVLLTNPGGETEGGGPGGLAMVMVILGPLLIGLLGMLVGNAHASGVKTLAREIDRLGSSGDPDRQLRAGTGEAALLARSVERMVGNLEFRSKHGDEDMEEIVSREQKIASEIHSGLMSKNPPRLANFEVETLFKPGFEIGGDHFEYFAIDERHLGVILLDTNVRGVQAAVVMAAAKAYVRAAAPGRHSPADVLRQVNRHLAGDLPPGRHVTALYAVIDQQEGKATLASAGHLPLLVYRHATGKVNKVNPEGIALGLDKGPVFDSSLEEGDIPIGVGDRIVLYTDGALQIQNTEGEEFGESRFYESVAKEAPKNSQAFVNFVGSAIDMFHVGAPQNDDITISTVKRTR